MEGLQLVYDSRGVFLWLGLLVLFAILAGFVVVLHLRLASVISHYRVLTRGVGTGRLDDLLEQHLERLDATSAKLDEVAGYCNELDGAVQRSLQRVGVVRFNPFSEVGGDQSFAVALLDAKGDGLVISSIFGRRESRVYVKPVERGLSKYALSDEEQQAIRQADGMGADQRA
ncbi:MAG: DUF4446 family protein [Chloroflexi bacterium]|nr:DUF4446 family protein [Chloroflexota bacterium]